MLVKFMDRPFKYGDRALRKGCALDASCANEADA